MNPSLKDFLSEEKRAFLEIIGEIPERAIMQQCGKEFCIMCGHPTNADETVQELEDFLAASHRRLLQKVVEMVEGRQHALKIALGKEEKHEEHYGSDPYYTNDVLVIIGTKRGLQQGISALDTIIKSLKDI